MRFEQLMQVVEIEKWHSISKAAKALYISQPALSAALSALEQEIGVKLFERASSGVRLTPEGEDILKLFKQILNCKDEVMNYHSKTKNLCGEITVLITQAYGFLFSDILMAFKERFPNAELDLQIFTPEEIVEKIARGNADIGVTIWELLTEQTHERLKEHYIQYETFGSHQMMLYVSQDSRFAENSGVSLDELCDEQFVAYSSNYWSNINKTLQATHPPLVMTDRENLKRLISEGHAIALMPETFARHDFYCEQGLIELIPIKGTEDFGQGTDHLLYPAKRELSLLAKGTLAILREILNTLQ